MLGLAGLSAYRSTISGAIADRGNHAPSLVTCECGPALSQSNENGDFAATRRELEHTALLRRATLEQPWHSAEMRAASR